MSQLRAWIPVIAVTSNKVTQDGTLCLLSFPHTHTHTQVWIPSRENTLKGTSRGLRSKQTSKHLGMEER